MLPHAKHATALLTRSTRSCVPGVFQWPVNSSVAPRCSHQAMAPVAEATSANEPDRQPTKKVKRNVALHVGYVGTDYTGGLYVGQLLRRP